MRNSWRTSTKLRLVSAGKATISAWICGKILAVASAVAISFIRAEGPTMVVAAADKRKVA